MQIKQQTCSLNRCQIVVGIGHGVRKADTHDRLYFRGTPGIQGS